MTEPLINTSIKSFRALKGGAPASANRIKADRFYDSEPPAPNASAVKKGLFDAPTGITSALKQIGSDPSYQITLPCYEVDDMPNKRINAGRGRLFNGSLLKAKPITGMDNIAFSPEMRIGTFGMDARQSPFTFGSFQYCGS